MAGAVLDPAATDIDPVEDAKSPNTFDTDGI
jgi:hypothetical protein